MALKTIFLRTLPLFLITGFFFGESPKIRGQDVGSSVVTAALGVPGDPDNGESPAVYITWWPTGDAQWNPGRYAIYSKSGQPDDPGDFSLVGVVQPLVDPLSTGVVISRSERLGQDLQALSDNIDGLFDRLLPVSGMTPAEKLAAIIDVSHVDPEAAETLALLTRRHPAAAMAAGVAFLDPIGTNETRTYEIRSCPAGLNPADCTTVSGRVIVTGGEVHYLPPPGQPVHVPFLNEDGDPDPRGNLNVPLRWATPDALRERSFFQFGYDVFRVDADVAERENWHNNRPERSDFLAHLGTEGVQQVNHLPILTDNLFSESDVGNFNNDPDTFFVIDDNRRYEDHGEPFEDGDTFYYFVAGRDLLNRPGEISEGTKVIVCFRLPPEAPTGLKVSNHYTWDASSDTQKQVLKLEWNEANPRDNGPEIYGYWIYRWESIEEMQQMQGNPFSPVPSGAITGGRIATVSANTTEFIDQNGPSLTYHRGGDLDAPAIQSEDHGNKTYWYTVRAIDKATCGGNLSGNSAPAYGVLRDRIGPEDPDGSVVGNCSVPVLELVNIGHGQPLDEDPSIQFIAFSAQALDGEIQWIEFFAQPLSEDKMFLGRFRFLRGPVNNVVMIQKTWFADQGLSEFDLLARVGTGDGKTSEFVVSELEINMDPKYGRLPYILNFVASIDRDADCGTHEIALGGDTMGRQIEPIEINMILPPKTEEWKLYRRIGNGPITLLKQGLDSYDPGDHVIEHFDYDLPLNGGRICYFLQVFDQHGNPSIMKRIGCVEAQRRRPLAQPLLTTVQSIGENPSEAAAKITWFAAPEGIERFQLAIRGPDIPGEISEDLRPDYVSETLSYNIIYVGETRPRSFLTGRVGANLGNGPEFSVTWTENLASGSEYFIRVRAIGAAGAVSEWSNEESFIWSGEIDYSEPFDPNDCVVPWPIRGLPEVSSHFPLNLPEIVDLGLKAVIYPRNPQDNSIAYSGGAIRVGLVNLQDTLVPPPTNWDQIEYTENGIFALPPALEEDGDLLNIFYHRKDETPLLNFMLYRYQVPDSIWPEVSGDVYQVSPLIEGIAYRRQMGPKNQSILAVHDPHFLIVESSSPIATGRVYDLYLKDTQPVVQNATYRYLIVRFDPTGEIDQVIPLPAVTATVN
ncbi:MAG TPA: fibronectin type III domain-containing protein [Opitutales bacterium]|nr:fibronectin type III domain-containing protein [Opitutales bacterium]